MSEILVIELLRRGFHEALRRVIAFVALAFIAEEIFVTLFPFASSSVLAEVPVWARIAFIIGVAMLIFVVSVIQQFTRY